MQPHAYRTFVDPLVSLVHRASVIVVVSLLLGSLTPLPLLGQEPLSDALTVALDEREETSDFDDALDDEDGERTIPDALATRTDFVPKFAENRFVLPELAATSTATKEVGNGRTPDGFRGTDSSPAQLLPEDASSRSIGKGWAVANWAAPNTYSRPRYFEDRMLERHGHERCWPLTPVISGVRFFATIPMLPYLGTISPPCDCEYTLGYYRPGSCAPAMIQRPPLDKRAVIVESAAVAGIGVILP